MPRVIFPTRRRARLSSQKSPFILAVFMAALVSLALATAPVSAAPDSKGTDFWLAFPSNLGGPELTLFIAGDTTTSGTVEIPQSVVLHSVHRRTGVGDHRCAPLRRGADRQ